MHLGTQQTHAIHIRLLAVNILFTHKDFTFHIEQGAGCCCGNTMLAGTCFGNDLCLAHTFGKQCLAKHVIDLVCARMVQLIALEIELCTAEMGGHALGKIERAGASDIMGLIIFKLALEIGIGGGALIGGLYLQDQRHQGLGNKASTMHSEPAALVRLVAKRVQIHVCHTI